MMVDRIKKEWERIEKEYNEINKILYGSDCSELEDSEDLTKEIIEKAAAGDSDAYSEYVKLEKSEKLSRLGNAKAELRKCYDEFNNLMTHEVTKANETREAKEARIWISHPDLYDRITKAERTLNSLQ